MSTGLHVAHLRARAERKIRFVSGPSMTVHKGRPVKKGLAACVSLLGRATTLGVIACSRSRRTWHVREEAGSCHDQWSADGLLTGSCLIGSRKHAATRCACALTNGRFRWRAKGKPEAKGSRKYRRRRPRTAQLGRMFTMQAQRTCSPKLV